MAISTAPYQNSGRRVRAVHRPARKLPSASPPKKAASTVATACTVTPKTSESWRTQSCWYTRPHAPDARKNAHRAANIAPRCARVWAVSAATVRPTSSTVHRGRSALRLYDGLASAARRRCYFLPMGAGATVAWIST